MPSPAPTKSGHASLLRRGALAFWFCGLGALGLLRYALHATRHGMHADAIGWLWLGGSLALCVLGGLLLVRVLRTPRSGADD